MGGWWVQIETFTVVDNLQTHERRADTQGDSDFGRVGMPTYPPVVTGIRSGTKDPAALAATELNRLRSIVAGEMGRTLGIVARL